LRTWKQFDENGSGGIYSIREWYDTMFRNAKHNIYLEDQFPFQDKIITQSLIKRLKEQRSLKVITVGPMDPNLPGFIFGKIAHESINDINRSEEHTSELQSRSDLVCRLLLEKKKKKRTK